MSWEKVKIKEIWKGFYDGPHATPPVSDCGGIFLGISNITPNGHIDLSDIKYISEQDLPKWTKRVVPQGGDIVFSYEATLNLYAIIPENFYGCLGRRMALIRVDENKISNKFLYYYFFSDEWRATIAENTIVGATVDRIPIAKFPEFPISLPSLKEQKRIADILSAYDDLIENNQKQIKLLEEAAQRLYKQWFIDLRYPGHETTKIVNGLPEGWKKEKFGDIVDYIRGTSYTSSELSDGEGVLLVNLKNINAFGGYKRNAEKRFTGKYKENGILEPGDLVMGCTDMTKERRLVGHVALIPNLREHAVFTMDLLKLLPKRISKTFLYAQCRFGGLSYKISPLANGANVLHLRPENMADIDVLCPDENIVEAFDKVFASMISKIEKLEDQIQLAAESRDRLLPKLMNGELEV